MLRQAPAAVVEHVVHLHGQQLKRVFGERQDDLEEGALVEAVARQRLVLCGDGGENVTVYAAALLPAVGDAVSNVEVAAELMLRKEVIVLLDELQADAVVGVLALVVPHRLVDAEAEVGQRLLALHLQRDARVERCDQAGLLALSGCCVPCVAGIRRSSPDIVRTVILIGFETNPVGHWCPEKNVTFV